MQWPSPLCAGGLWGSPKGARAAHADQMSGAAVVGEAEEGRAGAWPRPAGPQSGPAARRGEGGLAQATAPLPVAAVPGSASGPPRTAPAEPDAPAGAPGGLRWPDVLGKVLLQGGGAVGTEEALAEKEAKWCPGCRSFVPQLASSYDSALKEKGLAIVFVSSDHTEEEFDLFSGDMPWLALPFRERELARSLHRRFGVAGLPKLVRFHR
ncbi:unnamed protein product [Prorocentrum cordatum]|uniref:protein-disulfide reductase n=1 Tax=Prorocentrum cordatum TaxID=2364126 RepID=A0ABN9WGW5_9DINO|nr:unnamed protein product [Polarella glacialis]